MHKREIFPEKYLKQIVLTTPANINKPTVPGMQGNTYYIVATPLNSIKTHTPLNSIKTHTPLNSIKTQTPLNSIKTHTPLNSIKTHKPLNSIKTHTPLTCRKKKLKWGPLSLSPGRYQHIPTSAVVILTPVTHYFNPNLVKRDS